MEKEKINLYDKTNAAVLMKITKEKPMIDELRKKNKYDPQKPSFKSWEKLNLEYTTISNEKIRYAKSIVDEDAETIILLNPLPQSIVAYTPIWSKLAIRYNLYAYDLPGFGKSSGGVEFMNFEAQGKFLNDFINHFNIKNSHLIGPDIGMPAILDYVARYDNSIKSISVGDGPGVKPSLNGSIIDKMVNSSFYGVIFKLAGGGSLVEAGNRVGYVNYTPNDEELSDYKSSYKGKIPTILKWFRGYADSLDSLEPHLSKIKNPTLIFWGENDVLLEKGNAYNLENILKKNNTPCKVEIINNCGHFSYQDRHDEFLNIISDWVESNK